jgi:hypothetical protein
MPVKKNIFFIYLGNICCHHLPKKLATPETRPEAALPAVPSTPPTVPSTPPIAFIGFIPKILFIKSPINPNIIPGRSLTSYITASTIASIDLFT